MIRWANTGIYLLSEDGHTHSVMDPGHHHGDHEIEETYLMIMPAADGHTHDVIDLGHRHLDNGVAITGVRLDVANGHTHRVVEYGHQHL